MSRPGSLLKFERARKHLEEAVAANSAYLRGIPYSTARDRETEPGHDLISATLHEEPPETIALAAGDAIHTMRSALDHLVYEISEKTDPDPEATGFPITANEDDWVRFGERSVRLLPEEAQDLIKGMQVWRHSNPEGPDPRRLRQVQTLDVLDTHRKLDSVVFSILPVVGTHPDTSADSMELVHHGTLESGRRTLLVRLLSPTDVRIDVIPFVKVGLANESLNEPIESQLNALFRNVGIALRSLARYA